MPYNNVISRSEVQALVEEQVSTLMLQGLTNDSAVLGQFQRIVVPTNQTRFPVISALPTAYFVTGDTGLKQTSEVNWTNKYIDIHELAAIVPIPDAVLADTNYDLDAAIRPLLEQAIARALDAAVFFGINAPAGWPQDIAAAAVAAGNFRARGTASTNQGGLAEDVNQTVGFLVEDGYTPTGFVAAPVMQTRLRSARDANGQLLADVGGNANSIWGLPTSYPMSGLWPAGAGTAGAPGGPELFAMQRENFIVGVRQDFTVTVHRDGVIQDNLGAIQYNLMQQDMTAIRIVFRVGWQVSNPLNYSQPAEANRYPASLLRGPTT